MVKKASSTSESLSRMLDLLNQVLQLEYSLIVHYPRLASAIRDEQARAMVLQLGSASIRHADVVADTIIKLGGNPRWSFEAFPEQLDIITIFQGQLEKENLALQLHRQSARLAPDVLLGNKFNELAQEEEAHIQVVKNILSKLA